MKVCEGLHKLTKILIGIKAKYHILMEKRYNAWSVDDIGGNYRDWNHVVLNRTNL